MLAYDPKNKSDNVNPKTELVAFCQRKAAKSMSKDDIVYSVMQFDDRFQATVKLNCLDGEEFAGELASNEKEAMQHAANQALLAHAEEVAALKLPIKRPLEGADRSAQKAARTEPDEEDKPSLAVKSRLHTCCTQILGRELEEGDIVYTVDTVDDGQQAKLSLPNLPGDLGRAVWVGTVYPNKRDTKLSAATQAVEAILADPQFGSKIDMSQAKSPAEPLKRNKGQSGAMKRSSSALSALGWWGPCGMTKGKGKDKGAAMMQQLMAMAWWAGWSPQPMMKGGKAKGKAGCGPYGGGCGAGFGAGCGAGFGAGCGAGCGAGGGTGWGKGGKDWGMGMGGMGGAGCMGGMGWSSDWDWGWGADWPPEWPEWSSGWGADWSSDPGGDWSTDWGKACGKAGGKASGAAPAWPAAVGGKAAGKPCGKANGCGWASGELVGGGSGRGVTVRPPGGHAGASAIKKPQERQRISNVPVTGDVLDWKGVFGWLRPHVPVSHPAASKHEGKVYVHKKDVVGGATLEQGGTVVFHVYADSGGLGAEEVQPF